MQFPLALVNDAHGAGAEAGLQVEFATANDGIVEIPWEVPKDGLALQVAFTLEQRQQAFAIEGLLGRGARSGE